MLLAFPGEEAVVSPGELVTKVVSLTAHFSGGIRTLGRTVERFFEGDDGWEVGKPSSLLGFDEGADGGLA